MTDSDKRSALEERIDAAEKRIEWRLLRGNLRLIVLRRRIEKLEEQLKKAPSTVPYRRARDQEGAR